MSPRGWDAEQVRSGVSGRTSMQYVHCADDHAPWRRSAVLFNLEWRDHPLLDSMYDTDTERYQQQVLLTYWQAVPRPSPHRVLSLGVQFSLRNGYVGWYLACLPIVTHIRGRRQSKEATSRFIHSPARIDNPMTDESPSQGDTLCGCHTSNAGSLSPLSNMPSAASTWHHVVKTSFPYRIWTLVLAIHLPVRSQGFNIVPYLLRILYDSDGPSSLHPHIPAYQLSSYSELSGALGFNSSPLPTSWPAMFGPGLLQGSAYVNAVDGLHISLSNTRRTLHTVDHYSGYDGRQQSYSDPFGLPLEVDFWWGHYDQGPPMLSEPPKPASSSLPPEGFSDQHQGTVGRNPSAIRSMAHVTRNSPNGQAATPAHPPSTKNVYVCEWRERDESICGERFTGETLPDHLADHGITNIASDKPTVCRSCRPGKKMKRESILRHVREVHLGLKRRSERGFSKKMVKRSVKTFTAYTGSRFRSFPAEQPHKPLSTASSRLARKLIELKKHTSSQSKLERSKVADVVDALAPSTSKKTCGVWAIGTKAFIASHIRKWHTKSREDRKGTKCQWDGCDAKGMLKDSISRHVVSVHLGEVFFCKECGEKSPRQDVYEQHIERSEGCRVSGASVTYHIARSRW
ncbi:hypothetical protein BU15DRAFT_67657 [Melanogaster broomeanus]|nr:hypothetical protein BU15DRAFT_67657 [Melanogaster broomeanus]